MQNLDGTNKFKKPKTNEAASRRTYPLLDRADLLSLTQLLGQVPPKQIISLSGSKLNVPEVNKGQEKPA